MSIFHLHQGDCLEVLPRIPSNSIDAIVTDPPYEISFMGAKWDSTGIATNADMWAQVLRVLKPGGHLLCFSGARTYHRIVCAIEDAGFEVRDQIMWVFGSGFPKSHNLDGDWYGYGTALKPAHEPICMVRKPLEKGLTVAANVVKWGTGAIRVDWCRTAEGRWPANLIHDGSDEVLAAFPQAAGQLAAGQLADVSNTAPSAKTSNVYGAMKRIGEPSQDDNNDGAVGFKMKPGARRLDTGSAARFFYCAKTSKADRNEGLAEFEPKQYSHDGRVVPINTAYQRNASSSNCHPTVKPTDLMRYLCRLVTPLGGTVLDPFTGSGSTGKACALEGFSFIGIEQDASYVDIAEARMRHAGASITVFGGLV